MIALAEATVSPERIVRKLTGAPDGVASSDWLARVLGCEPEDLLAPLAELADSGRILVWPAAVGVLGVMLARTARARNTRTMRVKEVRRYRNGRLETGHDLGQRVDPRTEDRDPCGVPYPGLILLGERLTWPPPDWVPRRPCWACGGRKLSVDSYCLVCDRAGRTIRTWGVRAEAEPIRTPLPGDDGLAGGTGPAGVELEQELRKREAAQAERNRSAYGMDPTLMGRR